MGRNTRRSLVFLPTLLSCSSRFLSALQQNRAQSRLLYILSITTVWEEGLEIFGFAVLAIFYIEPFLCFVLFFVFLWWEKSVSWFCICLRWPRIFTFFRCGSKKHLTVVCFYYENAVLNSTKHFILRRDCAFDFETNRQTIKIKGSVILISYIPQLVQIKCHSYICILW